MIHSAALDKEYLPFCHFRICAGKGRSWSTLANGWGHPGFIQKAGMWDIAKYVLGFISPGGDGTRPRRWIVGYQSPFRRRLGLEAADSPRGR